MATIELRLLGPFEVRREHVPRLRPRALHHDEERGEGQHLDRRGSRWPRRRLRCRHDHRLQPHDASGRPHGAGPGRSPREVASTPATRSTGRPPWWCTTDPTSASDAPVPPPPPGVHRHSPPTVSGAAPPTCETPWLPSASPRPALRGRAMADDTCLRYASGRPRRVQPAGRGGVLASYDRVGAACLSGRWSSRATGRPTYSASANIGSTSTVSISRGTSQPPVASCTTPTRNGPVTASR